MQMTTTWWLVFPNVNRKIANTHPNKHTHHAHPPTHPPTNTQTSELDDYNKLSLWLTCNKLTYYKTTQKCGPLLKLPDASAKLKNIMVIQIT